jgi:hypothetical protein
MDKAFQIEVWHDLVQQVTDIRALLMHRNLGKPEGVADK